MKKREKDNTKTKGPRHILHITPYTHRLAGTTK